MTTEARASMYQQWAAEYAWHSRTVNGTNEKIYFQEQSRICYAQARYLLNVYGDRPCTM